MGPINSLPEGSAKVTKSASKANHLFAFTFLVSFDREPEKNASGIGVFLVRVPGILRRRARRSRVRPLFEPVAFIWVTALVLNHPAGMPAISRW